MMKIVAILLVLLPLCAAKSAYFTFTDCGGTNSIWHFTAFNAPNPFPMGQNVTWSATGVRSAAVTGGTSHFTSFGVDDHWNLCDEYTATTYGGGKAFINAGCGPAGTFTSSRWTIVADVVPTGSWDSTYKSFDSAGKLDTCLISTIHVS